MTDVAQFDDDLGRRRLKNRAQRYLFESRTINGRRHDRPAKRDAIAKGAFAGGQSRASADIATSRDR
jgi:hypothetical protein